MEAPRQSRNAFIDAIRAAAIAEVLLHHLVQQTGPDSWRVVFRAPVGVQLFLVLSGWLLGGQLFRALARDGRLDVARFWGRRWLRTLPAYWIVLAVRAASGRNTLAQTGAMVAFAQNYAVPHGWAISWSLCVQEHFYVALPLVLLVTAARRRLGIAVGAATVLVPPVLRWWAFRPSWSEAEYFAWIEAPTHMRLDGLVLGVLLAAWCAEGGPAWERCRRHARALAVLGVASIAFIGASPWFFDAARQTAVSAFASATGVLGLGVGAALLVPATTTAASSPRWWHAPAAWVADHGYVLYLLHSSVYGVVLSTGDRLHLSRPASALAAVATTLCAGWTLRTVVEKPALRARKWLLDRPRATSPSTLEASSVGLPIPSCVRDAELPRGPSDEAPHRGTDR